MPKTFKPVLCGLLLLSVLSGCYAREMRLDDQSPFGKHQAGLELRFKNAQNTDLSAVQQQFRRILVRRLGLQTRPLQKKDVLRPWVLEVKLEQKESLMGTPVFMQQSSPPRLRMEIQASGVLTHPTTNSTKTFHWVERGDTVPAQKMVLQAQLMDRLGAQIYRSLGPRYVYR